MNTKETNEIRELTAAELDAVSGAGVFQKLKDAAVDLAKDVWETLCEGAIGGTSSEVGNVTSDAR